MRLRTRLRKFLSAALVLCLLGGGVVMVDVWSALGTRPAGERLERIRRSPQATGDRFTNPLPERTDLWLATKRWLGGGPGREPVEPPPILARRKTDFDTPPATGLRVTWLGHSTLIVEIDGARFLVDPVFGERCSPSRFFGPKRFHAPPLPLDELPRVDAVVISHDHYDHLDHPTIRHLAASDVPFVVPLGVGAHLESWGVAAARVTELDWWDRTRVAGVELVATPSRHFSGRGVADKNSTLWAGWAFLGGQHRAFFSGDTAMFPGFSEIGQRLGPFDVTMIEVGAYDRAWADVHLGPEQAVEAHRALRGAVLLPVHWGTFNLAVHAWTEPAERLLAAAGGLRVVIPRPGESVEPASAPVEVARWWPEIPWQTADQHPVVSSGLGLAGLVSPPVEASP